MNRTKRDLLFRIGITGGVALIALGTLLGGLNESRDKAPALPAAQAQGESQWTGKAAPSVGNLKTIDGKTVSLEGYRGKVVVMDFWATWCPPCREAIPSLKSVHGKYGKKGVVVLGVSNEEKSTVAPFAKKNNMTYTVVADPSGGNKALEAYGVQGIPTLLVIDKKGKVRLHEVGYNPGMAAEMDRLLPKLLAE
jgi:Peroxiredoxin